MADKPKRPMSAYFLWLNENREKIKKENPDFKVTEIAKMGGEMWRALKDKTEWENKAIEAKENYTRAMQEYEKNGGGGKPASGGGKKRGKKDVKKPAKKSKQASEDESDEGSD